MITTRTVITVAAVWCIGISSLAAATTTEETKTEQQPERAMDTTLQQLQKAITGHDGAEFGKINVTDIATRIVQEYVTPMACSYSPAFCAENQLQSRGLQSYLATAGTLFAGVLGVMMSKITILIVISLISMIIGKIMLFFGFLVSSSHYHHGHYDHKYEYGHHHHAPYVKYTKDKYYIKHTPSEHNHDVIAESPPPESSHSPYHSHSPPSSGVSYYK